MSAVQLVTPNPDIYCRPGWCLQYVRETFGLPARYPTATAAWEASASQHRDRNFPAGVWVPVWYGLAREPAGHVVLLAPDGSCYSTSDNSNVPHHHPNLADLEAFYASWGWPLTYRGWTEDVAGYPVITWGGLAAQGTITPLEEPELDFEQTKQAAYEGTLKALEWAVPDNEGGKLSVLGMVSVIKPMVHDVPRALLDTRIPRGGGEFPGETTPRAVFAYADQKHIEALRAIAGAAAADGVPAEEIIQTVRDALAAGVTVDVKVGGKE